MNRRNFLKGLVAAGAAAVYPWKATGEWLHLAVTRESGRKIAYIDGVECLTGDIYQFHEEAGKALADAIDKSIHDICVQTWSDGEHLAEYTALDFAA